jgi:hypothetical protein
MVFFRLLICKTLHLIKCREEEEEEAEQEVFASAFEREQKRARPRTDEHGPIDPSIDRSARTNGKWFVYENCVTAESRTAPKALLCAELRLRSLLWQRNSVG